MTDPRRGPDWRWWRAEAIIRDDYQCQDCGVFGGRKGNAKLHAHHLTPVSEGGRETARQKLTRLADQGRIERRKKGRTIVWWQSAEVSEPAPTLKRLSQALDEPIVVGDTVYEDGDQHSLAAAESNEVETDE